MMSGKKLLIILLGGLFMIITNESKAECLNPLWNISDAPYTLNEVVSASDGNDYFCKDIGQGHLDPATATGQTYGWTLQSNPCATATTPTLGATTAAGVYCRTAFGNSSVTTTGGSAITARGIVFSTSTAPTTADDVVKDDYNVVGPYSALLDNLSPETTYFIRGYATNSIGTEYSTETSFTTDADVDCADCNLACDKTDATLLNPATWPMVIATTDTLCVTEDITVSTGVTVRGTVKICNDAQVTLTGSITMEGANTGFEGQIIYEGCNEMFIGTGSYTGYRTADNSENDGDQMLSYCSTCDNTDRSQFLANELVVAWWAAECRPESQLLPVELITFNAEKQNHGAIITWTTGSEINNDYFNVQTSIDGINWITIAMVQGAGNSSDEIHYSFFDNEPISEIQYYRLTQVDYDGTSTKSNIKTVKFENKASINPIIAFTNSNNEIEVQLGLNGFGKVYIIDARGRFVGQQNFISVDKNGTTLKFNHSELSKGIYFVNLISNNQRFSQKVSVIK